MDGFLRFWTKMAAILKWLRNCYVMLRHNLIMQTAKETFIAFADILGVRGGGMNQPPSSVVEDQKSPV